MFGDTKVTIYPLLILVGCLLVSIFCGVMYLPIEFSLFRRVGIGLFGGGVCFFCVAIYRVPN